MAMQAGIEQMQREGWEVVNTETISQGWDCFSTCLLGCIFIPLSLLGRKSPKYKVHYRKKAE